jgi:hypothetical protein
MKILVTAILLCLGILQSQAQSQYTGRWTGPVTSSIAGVSSVAGTVIMDIDASGNITSVLGSEFPFTGSVNNSGQVTFNSSGITFMTSAQITNGTMTGTSNVTPPGSPFPFTYLLTATKNGNSGGGGDPTILPYPSNVGLYRGQNGTKFLFEVTGSTFGQIWGTDIYTDDSSLARAAVHAGLLDVGKSGVVEVEIVSGQSSYTGSSRNGVTSLSWGAYSGSFSLGSSVETPPVDFAIDTQPANIAVEPGASTILSVGATGSGLSYQWFRGSAPDDANPVSGGTSATLSVTPLSNNETYWVKITNASGSLPSQTITITLLGTPSLITVGAKATGSFGVPVAGPENFVSAHTFSASGEQVILSPSGTITLGENLITGPAGITAARSLITGFNVNNPGYTALEEREIDLGNAAQNNLPTEVEQLGALIGIFVPQTAAGQAGFLAQDGDVTTTGLDSEDLFLIGADLHLFVAPGPGTLFLGINEAYALNNSGSFEVKVDPVIEADGLRLLSLPTAPTLIWAGNATLQTSPSLAPGSWTPLPTASSPFEITPNGSAFFRIAP